MSTLRENNKKRTLFCLKLDILRQSWPILAEKILCYQVAQNELKMNFDVQYGAREEEIVL